jgi:pimeloyl-ACP methyl ester carboxylesterase
MSVRLDDLLRALRPDRPENRAATLIGHALGAAAIVAAALGAAAVGAVAVGRLVVGQARIRRVEIDELVVRRLRITEEFSVPDGPGSKDPGDRTRE